MKHIVPAKTYDLMEAYVTGAKAAPKIRGDSYYDAEVEMKNGTRFLIQVCECTDETPYVQVVVIDKDGAEIGCTSDCDSFGGRYVILVRQDKDVILDVIRAKPKPKPKKRKKTMKLSTIQRLAFCNSQQLPRRVVHDGVVKEWVGIGWVTHEGEKPKPGDVYVVED